MSKLSQPGANGKKQWEKPEIIVLNIDKTKSGSDIHDDGSGGFDS
jgi:hypothetical protein